MFSFWQRPQVVVIAAYNILYTVYNVHCTLVGNSAMLRK